MNKIEEITSRYNDNNLTYIDREGEHQINIDEFVKTGSDNVLQKLNRTEQILLKVANAAPEKLKWVNDYAMAKVIKSLYERVDDLSAGLIAKDTEIERLQNEATASRVSFETEDGIPKEEAEKLLERIAGMEADEQILQSQLNQIIVERDELNEKYTALDERFNKSVEAYKELKNERDNISAKLVASSSESEQQYSELVKKYDELNEKHESLESEIAVVIDRHNETIKQDTYEIESLKTRLENAGEENLKLNDKIKELQQMKTDLEQELNSYAADFEKASARCQEIDSRNEELNVEYEKQKDLIAQLEEQYNNTCEELNNIKESFGDATGKIRELDSTNVELQNKVNEQETLINGLQETINSVNEEKDALQNDLEEKTKQNALLDAKIRNSENVEEKLHKFDDAVDEFLKAIDWNNNKSEMAEHKEAHDNSQHRMGDNQVVNFNMGM